MKTISHKDSSRNTFFSAPLLRGSLCLFPFLLFSLGACLSEAPLRDLPLTPGDREEINLNGEWETAVTGDPSYRPNVREWTTAEIPKMTEHNAIGGTRYIWYRKEARIPASFAEKQITLRLYGARFNATVFCDGVLIASRLEGFTPFSIDLTNMVTPGKKSLIEIRCQDWSATFKAGYRLPADASPNSEVLRGVPQGQITAPIGGHFTWFGIWDDIVLLARPFVHIGDIAIDTSFRKKQLTVSGSCTREKPGLWIEASVLDGDNTVLSLPGKELPGKGQFSLSAGFPDPVCWSPENPHLYRLTVSIREAAGGSVIDRLETPFGFREFWAEGTDFYLNGVKRHLLASSSWPAARYQSDQEIRTAIQNIKNSNAVAFRLHTQPWQHRWLELADELGLLIIEEGALWCDGNGGYAYRDAVFWENVTRHLEGMVIRDRNHPCLVMWSIENELLHCGAEKYAADTEQKLAAVGKYVKSLDPVHLITFEADQDPGGIADVIGLHYPHEIPEFTDYPNTADWLDGEATSGTEGGAAGSWSRAFRWDRKKPLYIGEYLWVFYGDYSAGSIFFGDDAYLDRERFHDKAKAEAWFMQTVAYRRAGVSGMCPWTIAEEGGKIDLKSVLYSAQKRAYEPVTVFKRNYDSRFFSGEKIERTFDVFNDSSEPVTLEFRCKLDGWRKGYAERFTLEPAGYKVVTVTVPLPLTTQKKTLAISAGLFREGKRIAGEDLHFQIFPRFPLILPAGMTLLVFDPEKRFSSELGKTPFTMLNTLEELESRSPGSSILLIGPSAFKANQNPDKKPVIGSRHNDATALPFRNFLLRGGKAVVLEQTTLQGVMSGVSLIDHPSTMTFPVSGAHPLLLGLEPDAFKFWRGDHYVTGKEIRRPDRYGGRAVLVSGGVKMLDQAPIIEMNPGKGLVLFCQALVGTKYSAEPVARILLQNAVNYLSADRNKTGEALLVADEQDGAAFAQKLKNLGVSYTLPAGVPGPDELKAVDLLILHGGGKRIEALAPLLKETISQKKPLTVYWHAPEQTSFERVLKSLGLAKVTVSPSAGPLQLIDRTNPVSEGILLEDVTFLKLPGGLNWYHQVADDPTVIDRAIDLEIPSSALERYDVENWQREGTYVRLIENDRVVAFYTNGTVTGEVSVRTAGFYRIQVAASGTPAFGVWPSCSIKVNGRQEGQIVVKGTELKTFPLILRLPAGRSTLSLSFINDAYSKEGDRNLFLDALFIETTPLNFMDFSILSLPPALVTVNVSPSLRLVVDCVRWESAPLNQVKADRYAMTILSNVGASFSVPARDPNWIPSFLFSPVGKISVWRKTNSELVLSSAGTVSTDFTCAAAGTYTVFVMGSSTPAEGVYAKAIVKIDGGRVGEAEIASVTQGLFTVGEFYLTAGAHRLSMEFSNDLWTGEEDRNLHLRGIGFMIVDQPE